MAIPESIQKLIQRYDNNRQVYRSSDYKEAQIRLEFLDPFFGELGWDMANKQGYSETFKEVLVEQSIKVGDERKAPDYTFRIGQTPIFYVEAKKPSVNLKDDISPSFQLRRYAWSTRLPLSILTDFEEFAVYDCRTKPDKHDKASTGRLMYLDYRQYPEKWDEIAAIFSKQAVLQGSFERYAQETKGKHGTADVDDAFLSEIERWRDLLARNIALRNPQLSQRELNYTVQMTIDRLIFLRICEDRNIEPYEQLKGVLKAEPVYPELCRLFQQADARYNSGLFHFRDEKGQADPPDTLTQSLVIDDKPLKDIIKNIYYPDSPYAFAVMPAEILGQVYERFLGKIIRLTEGHHAVVEDKPEVKKAGGVFYTPTYIVDYIVKQTVGKLLEGKSPDDPGLRRGIPYRILDMACGSGSFLLGAYQYLLDWYLAAYLAEGAEKWGKGKNPALYPTASGGWKLTIAERKRILLEHIYGVDIDSQAVEVTKLSLLLKVLEGESEQSMGQLSYFKERVLPDLGQNIKCGNSLIGPDIFSHTGLQSSYLDNEVQYKINAFNWQKEFSQVFNSSGGFDAVIGNPPYVRQETLGDFKPYFQRTYQVYHGIADLYSYFIEKGISILRTGGIFSFIVANKWLRANYGEPLRRWLKSQMILEITDFGDLPVFQNVTTYPCILRVSKTEGNHETRVTQVRALDFHSLYDYVQTNHYIIDQTKLDDKGWSLEEHSQSIIDKLKSTSISLEKYVQAKVYYGLKTGLNDAFVIDTDLRWKLISSDIKSEEVIKPFLIGREIKRYQKPSSNQFLILIPRGWTRQQSNNAKDAWGWFKKNYPAVANHLAPFKEAAEKRYDKGEYWWELRACDYYPEFEKPKIIYPNICKRPEFTYDSSGQYTNQKCFIIPTDDKYLLGILNSTLSKFLFSKILPKLRGDFYEPSFVYFRFFPIRQIIFSDPNDIKRHDTIVSLVERMLLLHEQHSTAKTPTEKTMLQRQVEATDHEIDALVYQLYGLTEEEIKIVEGG